MIHQPSDHSTPAQLTEEMAERKRAVLDDARPDAVAQQRKYGKWTARDASTGWWMSAASASSDP